MMSPIENMTEYYKLKLSQLEAEKNWTIKEVIRLFKKLEKNKEAIIKTEKEYEEELNNCK